MNILVTGGAGYIGSHTIISLIDNGFSVIVIDNFCSGHIEATDAVSKYENEKIKVYDGDFSDAGLLDDIIKRHNINGVIHFAAHSLVGESMDEPLKYYKNNVAKTILFLEFLKKSGINNFVFSSSAAVYGTSDKNPIDEASPLNPINAYGNTKLVVENILGSMDRAYGFKYISLRYFNAAGANKSGQIGEDHNPETHLIPRVLKSVATGENKAVVFGNDYPTDDGTAIRDYIHVDDLSYAHVLSLKFLIENEKSKSGAYNLGYEKGYSVMDVLGKIEEITGKKLKVEFTGRREGDPAILVASHEKIKKELGFEFKYNICDIISSAWNWHSNHPNGFSKAQA
ncbi:MAG: UDP-glucose 4-epimerase GalE [Deltaproteobacteria bacterium]|nr:UDP-glucose 4-epimerase GalE [Deltaproteobacteria bacterium]